MTTATLSTRHLQIQLQVGATSQGRPKLKTLNFANVNVTASDDDIMAVGEALSALCADTVYQIGRVDQATYTATQNSIVKQA